MTGTLTIYIRRWWEKIDWKLFLFLLLFLNVKLIIKVVALLIIYFIRPDFRFGFRFNKNSRLPLFYLLMIVIAIFNWLISGDFFDTNYNFVILTGITFWVLCILATHQVKLTVETTAIPIIHNTLFFFFITNALISFLNLGLIIWETGTINPYLYQGMHQKYFIGTGDVITGITFDTSTTNAIISAFGVVYSLKRSNFFLTLVCMSVLLLTSSNFTNMLLLAALFFLLLFQSNRNQKSVIIICSLMLLIFLVKISPQNGSYVVEYSKKFFNTETTPAVTINDNTLLQVKPDSLLSEDEKRKKIALLYLDSIYLSKQLKVKPEAAEDKLPAQATYQKPTLPKPNIHSEPYQFKRDTTLLQKNLLEFAENKIAFFDTSLQSAKSRKLPGKLVAFQQTIDFFKKHPSKLFSGTGIGNFSSKLAFRATGLKIAGGYPSKFAYINNDFKNNHLNLYLFYFSKHMELHSLVNTPNSVYDQLLAEYGIAGLLSFLFLYLGFFMKDLRQLTYGVPLLIILAGALGVEYWFEQLSIIILFELMMFLNIKEAKDLSKK
jgi:hypothetical protein